MSKKQLTEAERRLKEAEEFLEEKGWDSTRTEIFFRINMVKKVIDESYSEVRDMVMHYAEICPEELKEKSKKLLVQYTDYKEKFEEDVKMNFKIKLYSQLALIDDLMKSGMIEEEIVKETYTNILLTRGSIEAATKDINNICKELQNMLVSDFMEKLYEGYIPTSVSEEEQMVMKFLSSVFGGALIPVECIFPEIFNESECEEPSAEENKKKD